LSIEKFSIDEVSKLIKTEMKLVDLYNIKIMKVNEQNEYYNEVVFEYKMESMESLIILFDKLKTDDEIQLIQFVNNNNAIYKLYKNQNETNQFQFEQQRAIQQIPQLEIPDSAKIEMLNQALQKITTLTVSALKHSISGIKTPTALVTDVGHIEEFLNNCDRAMFVKIRDHIIKLRESSEFKPVEITCANCTHEYKQQLTLDQTSFFAPAS
jgi:hypothetical protein